MKHKTLFFGLLLYIFVVGCAQQFTVENTKDTTLIATTFYPLYDFTRTIVGDSAEVYSIVPIGSEPHSFKETPQDLIKLSEADVFVTLGTEFEAFEERLIKTVEDDLTIIAAGSTVELIDIDEDEHDHEEKDHDDEEHHEEIEEECKEHNGIWIEEHDECEQISEEDCTELGGTFNECASACRNDPDAQVCTANCVLVCSFEDHDEEVHDHHEEEDDHEHEEHEDEHDHAHSGVDPHIWLSPSNAMIMVQSIEKGLSDVNPQNEEIYKQNAQALLDELQQLDNEFEQSLSSCAKDTILVAHNAYSYLARDYGFTTIEISGLSPEVEPSPKQIAKLIDEAKEHDLKVIFYEELVNPKVSNAIADQVGATTLPLKPAAYAEESESYTMIMRENLDNLKIALECT